MEAERKKKELAAKRTKSEEIFKIAKRSRKGTFKNLDFENKDSNEEQESEEEPEITSKISYKQLKTSHDFLEKEKVQIELVTLQKKFSDLQKKYDEECSEIVQLRSLNRQLQEKILDLPITLGGCSHMAGRYEPNPASSDSETPEVELGAGILIDRKVYNEIFQLDHIRKFTKSLAVCIWGTSTLAGRSVKGKACKNRNGPKKFVPNSVQTTANSVSKQESKPPLTPEKLAVISGQMREYMLKRGKTMPEIEAEIKNRNRYISDKIQDICSNLARAEARKNLFKCADSCSQ